MLVLQREPTPQPHHVPASLFYQFQSNESKNQNNLQCMHSILGITFSRVSFDEFSSNPVSFLLPIEDLKIFKRFGDFLAAAQAYSMGSWPSQAAGKGISGLSAMTLCVCSCAAACNAAQKRGDLVKSVNRKIFSVSVERMHTSITQVALIAALAVCQIFFISFFIQKLRCCFHDCKVVISQRGVFSFCFCIFCSC